MIGKEYLVRLTVVEELQSGVVLQIPAGPRVIVQRELLVPIEGKAEKANKNKKGK